ncbi:MAG: hypothetical protein MZV70_50090 [Desulfobacterales bacterium]|nr:hypothetical protein [Desulfobacterales bacterium]
MAIESADLDTLGENFEKPSVARRSSHLDPHFLIVLEAESGKEPSDGKEPVRRYARSRNCRFVIRSNGNRHCFYQDLERGKLHIIIISFPASDSITGYQHASASVGGTYGSCEGLPRVRAGAHKDHILLNQFAARRHGQDQTQQGIPRPAQLSVATVIYDATCWFCERFPRRGPRMSDQMVQAARRRPGRDIAGGSRASATSSRRPSRGWSTSRVRAWKSCCSTTRTTCGTAACPGGRPARPGRCWRCAGSGRTIGPIRPDRSDGSHLRPLRPLARPPGPRRGATPTRSSA